MATHDLPDHLPEIAPPVLATERKPVDVLAVLRRHFDLAQEVASDAQVYEAREVLEAVTELFNKANGIKAMEKPWHLSGGAEEYGFTIARDQAAAILRPALARVQGGAG